MVEAKTIKLDNIVRSLLFVSDIHAGSPYAVSPSTPVVTSEGNNLTASRNKGQKELLKHWNEMIGIADAFKVDTVFNLGDSIDGGNVAEGGRRLTTADLTYQREMAFHLLEPLVKDRKYYGISGSLYHQSIDSKIHEELANDLKGVASDSKFLGVSRIVRIKGTNKRFDVAHDRTSAMLYTATILDREQLWMKYAEAVGKLPKVDYMVSGHLHLYSHLDLGYVHIIQVGAWKAYHVIRGKARLKGRFQPDIGFVIVLIDRENRSYVKAWNWNAPRIGDREIWG